MFSSGFDLFKKDWLEVVFFNKNKSYGAYQLRNNNGYTTTLALAISSFIFIGAFLIPKALDYLNGTEVEVSPLKQTEVTLVTAPTLPKEEIVVPIEQAAAPAAKSRKPIVKFAPPVVKLDAMVTNEEPPKLIELVENDPGLITEQGDKNAAIVIPNLSLSSSEGTNGNGGIGNNDILDHTMLEMMPMPEGGMSGFRKYLSNNIKYPPMALDANVQGTVLVNFVVEKDGSLTDINVERKVGGGLDEEAVRVIKRSKKWTPGIQNGKAVRVRYSVPVKFALN